MRRGDGDLVLFDCGRGRFFRRRRGILGGHGGTGGQRDCQQSGQNVAANAHRNSSGSRVVARPVAAANAALAAE
jgi:hypothetical protein